LATPVEVSLWVNRRASDPGYFFRASQTCSFLKPLAPGRVKGDDLRPPPGDDIPEPVSKGAAGEGDHLTAGRQEVRRQGLQSPRARAGQEDHRILHVEKPPKTAVHFLQQVGPFIAPVADHGPGSRLPRTKRHVHRPRCVEMLRHWIPSSWIKKGREKMLSRPVFPEIPVFFPGDPGSTAVLPLPAKEGLPFRTIRKRSWKKRNRWPCRQKRTLASREATPR